MGKFLLPLVVEKMTNVDGEYPTVVPGLTLYRQSSAGKPLPCVFNLGLGVAIQGSKRVILENDIYDYNDGQSLVTSVDMPVISHVTKASSTKPFLGLYLKMSNQMVSEVIADMDLLLSKRAVRQRAMEVVDVNEDLLDALYRLVCLLQNPQLISVLAPLIQKEIIIRLLDSPHGIMLRLMATNGSKYKQLSNVIAWIKYHFTEDFSVTDLANKAHMSVSAFRQHFREITGMSPLQYTKKLRLQAARQLMINEHMDANSSALQVGYESASQFSREYTRFFGSPPLRDIKNFR